MYTSNKRLTNVGRVLLYPVLKHSTREVLKYLTTRRCTAVHHEFHGYGSGHFRHLLLDSALGNQGKPVLENETLLFYRYHSICAWINISEQTELEPVLFIQILQHNTDYT
jgi:hypothetical protein